MNKKILFLLTLFIITFSALADATFYRYSDDKKIYQIKNSRIYRYSDDRQLFYYSGMEHPGLIVVMVLLSDPSELLEM